MVEKRYFLPFWADINIVYAIYPKTLKYTNFQKCQGGQPILEDTRIYLNILSCHPSKFHMKEKYFSPMDNL